MTRSLIIALAVATVTAGCGRQFAMRCEDPTVYAGSSEIPPVRVPGDLSVPDETQALRIPQPEQLGTPRPVNRRGPCLESPPDYFEDNPAQAPAPPPS